MIQAAWRISTDKFKTTLLRMCAWFPFSDSGTDDEDDEEEDTPKKKTKKKTAKDSSPSASSAKEKKSKSKGMALGKQGEGLNVLRQASQRSFNTRLPCSKVNADIFKSFVFFS